MAWHTSVASFTKEVNRRFAKRPLKSIGRFANLEFTSLVKAATGDKLSPKLTMTNFMGLLPDT